MFSSVQRYCLGLPLDRGYQSWSENKIHIFPLLMHMKGFLEVKKKTLLATINGQQYVYLCIYVDLG